MCSRSHGSYWTLLILSKPRFHASFSPDHRRLWQADPWADMTAACDPTPSLDRHLKSLISCLYARPTCSKYCASTWHAKQLLLFVIQRENPWVSLRNTCETIYQPGDVFMTNMFKWILTGIISEEIPPFDEKGMTLGSSGGAFIHK